jgi:hypothetical protein
MKETKPQEGERRDVISQLENQIATYSDVLYEKMDEISYAEYLSPKKDAPHYGTKWEEYVDIKKSDMKNLTYDQLLLFLKNIDAKKHQGRLNLLKGFLMGRGIPFKDGLWDWQTRNLN